MAKIAFVQNLFFEYLGVMYLSSVLKRGGHTVEMFIPENENNLDLFTDEISAFQPDLVGFSCTTGSHNWALKCADNIKRKIACKTIFGGPHPTYFPEIINNSIVDIVCRGEGEFALLEICDNIDRHEDYTSTLSCWFKQNDRIIKNDQRYLLEDLDTLPFPDRSLYVSKYPYFQKSQKVFIASLGCPFNCTFCFNHQYKELYKGKGKFVRYRSVDNIIKELKEVKQTEKNFRTVYMQDDTFILNRKWVKDFTQRYAKEINLPFICLIRADLADEDVIKNLGEANCKNVFFGIETGVEKLRNELLQKSVTDDQIYNTAKLLKKYGIKFRTYNMLGLPGETLEEAFQTVAINAKIKTNYPWCSLFYPLPGTELAQFANENNLIDTSNQDAEPSFFKGSSLRSDNRNELINLQKLFYYAVKFPWMMPFIKLIIKLRPNIFFEFCFLIGYAISYMGSENLTLKEVFSVAKRNFMRFFFGSRDENSAT